ncbi:protein MpUGT1 [Marchantia polymorpha subsp. ruderalis]
MLPHIHSLHSPEALQSLDIRLAIMDHDESERELHEDWGRPFKDSYAVMRAAEPYSQNMASARSSGAAGLPTCVIADMFCLWAQILFDGISIGYTSKFGRKRESALVCESAFVLSQVPKVFTIGPLAAARTEAAAREGEREECLEWLDRQLVSSVVYICYGSMAKWTPESLRELALAPEASQCRFLWFLYQESGDDLVLALPAQFLERVGECGKVVTYWVPQVQIIQHQALICKVYWEECPCCVCPLELSRTLIKVIIDRILTILFSLIDTTKIERTTNIERKVSCR